MTTVYDVGINMSYVGKSGFPTEKTNILDSIRSTETPALCPKTKKNRPKNI
jgi:hypothetical protein